MLPDLSGTPWRGIILSERLQIWTLVDAADYDWLIKWNWNVWHGGGRGAWKEYAKRNVGPDRATIRMHREIMRWHDPRGEEFEAMHHVDHINGCALDNRYSVNLCWATPSQNALNRNKRQHSPPLSSIVHGLLKNVTRELEDIPF